MKKNIKKKLRKEFLAKRNNLSDSFVFEMSEKINQKLFIIKEYKKAKTIFFYASKDNEVRTDEMITDNLMLKKIFLPKINGNKIKFCEIKELNKIKVGCCNIREPNSKATKIKPDIVIVPGIVFDKKGYRIGFGKGYYDYFLKQFKGLKIGLAFDFQIIDKIHTEKHDIKVDMIITEKKIIVC